MSISGGDRAVSTPPGVIVVEIFLYLGAVFELLAGVVILGAAAVSDRATDLETFERVLAGFLIFVGLLTSSWPGPSAWEGNGRASSTSPSSCWPCSGVS
jgi:hypothetical protein